MPGKLDFGGTLTSPDRRRVPTPAPALRYDSPALDGGHMALLAFERVRGKDLSLDLKEKILTGGFLLLASLMALVIFLDLMKLRK